MDKSLPQQRNQLSSLVSRLRADAFAELEKSGYPKRRMQAVLNGKAADEFSASLTRGEQARRERRVFDTFHVLLYLRDFEQAWKSQQYSAAACSLFLAADAKRRADATEKRMGAYFSVQSRRQKREDLEPKIREAWAQLKRSERTPEGLSFQLAHVHAVRRGPASCRADIERLKLS